MEHDELKFTRKKIKKLGKTLSSERFVAMTKGLGLGHTILATKTDVEKKEPSIPVVVHKNIMPVPVSIAKPLVTPLQEAIKHKNQVIKEDAKKILAAKATRTTNEILFKKQVNSKSVSPKFSKRVVFFFLAHGIDLSVIFLFSFLVYWNIQIWVLDDITSKHELQQLWIWFQKRGAWKIAFFTYFIYFSYWCVFKIIAHETLGKYILRQISITKKS